MKLIRPLLTLCVLLAIATLLFAAIADHQKVQTPPIQLGTSGGNVNDISRAFCCSGTLGSLVTQGSTAYILSNNHVLARQDQAAVGEDISQPGLIDSGCKPVQIVADFSKAVTLGNNVDAALAAARPDEVDANGTILEVGQPSSTPVAATVGRGVAKSGRTTGLTCASVASVNTSVNVQYQKGCGKGKKYTLSYTNQVVVNSSSFSAGGDSGSLIVTSDTAQPTALLFAGSSTTTIGNPIGEVLTKLDAVVGGTVSFVGASSTHAVNCPAGAAGAGGTAAPSAREIDRVTAVKERQAPGLMLDPAVMGVGVGAHPDNPSEAVMIVYLDQNRALGRPIPEQIEGARTVIYRTDTIRAYGWNEKQMQSSCSAR